MAAALRVPRDRSVPADSWISHHSEKLTKDIMRIMRTRRRFGVELYTQHRLIFQPQTLERIIVQALIRNFHFLWIQVCRGNTIVMILRRDENFTSGKILNRVIPTMMPEL